jgi:signal transduction histidine kinase
MGFAVNSSHQGSIRQALWLRALGLGVAFFVLGMLADTFTFPPTPSAVLWLPSGLTLAFLLRTPPSGWPALLAAIFLAEFVSVLLNGLGTPITTALLWSLGNCLRSLLGAWLMRNLVGTPIRLSRSWEVAGLLLFGAVVSPLASATLGVLGIVVWTGPSSFMSHWVSWWLSDGLGTILVAPLLLTGSSSVLWPGRLRRILELGVMLSLTALSAHLVFGQPSPSGVWTSLTYVSFAFVLWGALRLGPLGGASTAAVVASVAIWHTLLGRGPFGTLAAPPPQKVFTLQIFLAILAVMALMLAAAVSERRRAERLQQLLVEAGTVLAASLDVRETIPRVARLVTPRTCTGFAVWLESENGLLERIAQAGWSAAREDRVRGALPPLPTASHRWRTPEGTVVLAPLWVRGSVKGALVLMSDERAWCEGSADLRLAEDLAHRFSMALENARLYEEARQAIEARNEFIAIAAHELRTPLTSLSLRMRSLDGLLHRERASAEVHEKVRAASRQIGRLTQLVERLLDVGRITTGRLELQPERVEVHELVEQVVEGFSEEARRLGATLRVEAQAGLTAWWDRGRVEQALANLLANSLKFGAGHPIEIRVSGEGPWVRIAVTDHGIGIAPEALERIFERFERAVSSRRYGGLGLGLFLARQIAESHGGTIHVESHPGEGATFVLQLPTRQQPSEEVKAEAEHPPLS